MSGATQRKKRVCDGCPRPGSKRSRRNTGSMTSELPPQTIDVENDRLHGEDVVDLTSEAPETSVVDLTNTDTFLVDEGPQSQESTATEGYVLISDEEEAPATTRSLQANPRLRSTAGEVGCLICFDTYAEIVQSGRGMVSTLCGHVFCRQCLCKSLNLNHFCPQCRTKLTRKQYHPIYF